MLAAVRRTVAPPQTRIQSDVERIPVCQDFVTHFMRRGEEADLHGLQLPAHEHKQHQHARNDVRITTVHSRDLKDARNPSVTPRYCRPRTSADSSS